MGYFSNILSYVDQYYTGPIKSENEANAKFTPKRSKKIKNKRKNKNKKR